MPRAYFNGQELSTGGTCTPYKVGDTLVEENGVINVAIPLNGIISQKDFDALPSDKQNYGGWLIPDSQKIDQDSLFPFGNADIYSTDEMRIGTWIDGKPLYRKVIKTKTVQALDSIYTVATPPSNIENVILDGVIINKTGGFYPINYRSVDDGVRIQTIMANSTMIRQSIVNYSNALDCDMLLIFQYTKTTDNPDNATQDLVSDLKIEEYDTTVDGCDWHVRKWSNGYVEMSGIKWYSKIPIKIEWGNLYVSDSLDGFKFPISLVKKYDERLEVVHKTSYTSIVFPVFSTLPVNSLEATPYIVAYRGASDAGASFGLTVSITGRWK